MFTETAAAAKLVESTLKEVQPKLELFSSWALAEGNKNAHHPTHAFGHAVTPKGIKWYAHTSYGLAHYEPREIQEFSLSWKAIERFTERLELEGKGANA